MSVKEFLKRSSAQFLDATPVLPDGVRIVAYEKSASELARVNLDTEWDVRWWCDKWSVTKERLLAAVDAVGPSSKKVAEYLGRPSPI